jgi:hypothetical protein
MSGEPVIYYTQCIDKEGVNDVGRIGKEILSMDSLYKTIANIFYSLRNITN